MHVNYNGGRKDSVSAIKTNISSKDVKTKEGKLRYENMMKYFSDEFILNLEYNKGDELVKEAAQKGIDLSSAVLIPHENGTALCFCGYYSDGPRFSPYINFDCHNFLSGWTFSTGHFADVTVYADDAFDGYLSCVTTDCLPCHSFFLLWLFEQLEAHFYDNSFDVPNYERHLNWCNKMAVEYHRMDGDLKFQELKPVYEGLVTENQRKRVDTLKINGISVSDYIRNHKIFRYAHSDNDIFKMSLFFKKPYKQLHKYLENANIAVF